MVLPQPFVIGSDYNEPLTNSKWDHPISVIYVSGNRLGISS